MGGWWLGPPSVKVAQVLIQMLSYIRSTDTASPAFLGANLRKQPFRLRGLPVQITIGVTYSQASARCLRGGVDLPWGAGHLAVCLWRRQRGGDR
jgi:hypothetical protein